MAEKHGKSTVLLGDEIALTGYITSSTFTKNMATADVTVYGLDDRKYIAGLTSGSLNLDGVFDADANASDAELYAAIDASAGKIITVGYGGLAIGTPTGMIQAYETNYNNRAAVDDAVRLSATFQGTGQVVRGISFHDLTAETGAADFASVNNGASTLNGGVAHLHVTAFSGTDCTIKLEDSTDNAAWAELIAFSTVSGVTQERKTVTGTVNQYVRAAITAGTFSSVTFAVSFGRLLR